MRFFNIVPFFVVCCQFFVPLVFAVQSNRADVVLVIDMVNKNENNAPLADKVVNGLHEFIIEVATQFDIGPKPHQTRMAVMKLDKDLEAIVSLKDGQDRQAIKDSVKHFNETKPYIQPPVIPDQLVAKVKGKIFGGLDDRKEAPNVVIFVVLYIQDSTDDHSSYTRRIVMRGWTEYEPYDLLLFAGGYDFGSGSGSNRLAVLFKLADKVEPFMGRPAAGTTLVALNEVLGLCEKFTQINESQCYFAEANSDRCVYQITISNTGKPTNWGDLDRFCAKGESEPYPCEHGKTECEKLCNEWFDDCPQADPCRNSPNRFQANCLANRQPKHSSITPRTRKPTLGSTVPTNQTRTTIRPKSSPMWAIAMLTGCAFMIIVAISMPVVLAVVMFVRRRRHMIQSRASVAAGTTTATTAKVPQMTKTHYFDRRNLSSASIGACPVPSGRGPPPSVLKSPGSVSNKSRPPDVLKRPPSDWTKRKMMTGGGGDGGKSMSAVMK